MQPQNIEIIGTLLFICSVLHTLSVKVFLHLAERFRKKSIPWRVFQILGDIEMVFGFWAAILLLTMAIFHGTDQAAEYLRSLSFTEPLFVLVVMTIAATRPVIDFAQSLIKSISSLFPVSENLAFYATALTIGPLLGSFITEPAAMTVTALVLRNRYFRNSSPRFRYLTLGVLFVNISIGGALTPFAAPPILMVAGLWNWDLGFMLSHFGWRVGLAVLLNVAFATGLNFKELTSADLKLIRKPDPAPIGHLKIASDAAPIWLQFLHLTVLAAAILCVHHLVFLASVFVLFLALFKITKARQESPLALRQSLCVAFFLSGLVVLGSLQSWWLKPLIQGLQHTQLFLSTTLLTAFADNAALTYLGAQVPDLTEAMKYALVAGALAGGGLTVIANAPNPAGFAILSEDFGPEGISAVKLAGAALGPTLIAMTCLGWLFT